MGPAEDRYRWTYAMPCMTVTDRELGANGYASGVCKEDAEFTVLSSVQARPCSPDKDFNWRCSGVLVMH